jgi:hypothetical protein
MDRETIIKLAREAGYLDLSPANRGMELQELERFAKLAAEHIRQTEFKPDWNNYQQGRKDGAAEEREEVALLVEELGAQGLGTLAIAAAIRQRNPHA